MNPFANSDINSHHTSVSVFLIYNLPTYLPTYIYISLLFYLLKTGA